MKLTLTNDNGTTKEWDLDDISNYQDLDEVLAEIRQAVSFRPAYNYAKDWVHRPKDMR